jgi:hypothetical protein
VVKKLGLSLSLEDRDMFFMAAYGQMVLDLGLGGMSCVPLHWSVSRTWYQDLACKYSETLALGGNIPHLLFFYFVHMDATCVGCVFLLFPDNENGSHVGRLGKKIFSNIRDKY